MYGLPADFNTSVFVGQGLESVCFNVNQIHFRFDNKLSISCEGHFAYFTEQEEKEQNIQKIPVTSSGVMHLLGHRVVDARAERDGTLTLRFDNEQRLVFYDNSPQYEAYHIQIGDKTIIV